VAVRARPLIRRPPIDSPLTRLFAYCCALGCALVLSLGALTPSAPAAGTAGSAQASGTVVALGWSSFTLRLGGRRMSIVRALTAAANEVARGDYPYVYGGGHAQAGTASIGIRGPGYNGRRFGFDCSGSVGAVLAGAGLLAPGMPVPNDAGIIAGLRQQRLIVRGVGRGADEVTFYDRPGVHIFMNIDGRYFGTSDGGAGNPSQRHGGAGWLDDGAPDTLSRAFKPYHLVASALSTATIYGPTLTFGVGRRYDLLDGVALGDDLHVAYTRGGKGALTAAAVTWLNAQAVSGTVSAIAADQSSFTVLTTDGRSVTFATSSPRLLDWLAPGDAVQVTYTAEANRSLIARSIQTAPSAASVRP
jgi:hypothetical protein